MVSCSCVVVVVVVFLLFCRCCFVCVFVSFLFVCLLLFCFGFVRGFFGRGWGVKSCCRHLIYYHPTQEFGISADKIGNLLISFFLIYTLKDFKNAKKKIILFCIKNIFALL